MNGRKNKNMYNDVTETREKVGYMNTQQHFEKKHNLSDKDGTRKVNIGE